MTRRLKHAYWITAEPYSWAILIYVGSWAQFRSHIKRTHSVDMGEQEFGGGFHTTIHNKITLQEVSLIWLPDDPLKTMQGVRGLSHELLHAAITILHHVGVPMGYEDQEALCYLHEGLNRCAQRKLNE